MDCSVLPPPDPIPTPKEFLQLSLTVCVGLTDCLLKAENIVD